ncbi:MAG: hypothetical protein ABFE13_04060 [Phycisphaerales bacterium]
MHHGSDSDNRDKRFKLKIRHVILAVFVALLGVAIVHIGLLSSGANRRLEALRAAGQPTSLAELALRNKLPMGMENAAAVYERAFAAFVPPPEDANVPYVGRRYESPRRGVALSEPVAKAVVDCLAANEKCLALLHEAAAIPTCRYDYDYRQSYPHLSSLRSCVLLLRLADVHYAGRGDPNAVVTCVKDALSVGDSLQDEPLLMPYLVQQGCVSATIAGLEHALSWTGFTDSQLKDLDAAFAATSDKIDLVQAMTTERCYMIDCVRDPSMLAGMGRGLVIFKFPGIRSQGIIDIVDYMNACVEAAGLPPVQRVKRFGEIDGILYKSSILHVAAQMLVPAVARIEVLDSRARAHLDLAGTALAVERHRLATGNVPGQLADLVPKYMEQVPIDPFDGQPIRYRRTEPGYVLWSVMDDGKDNGGKERDEVGKDEPYDLCFIVTR